MEHNKSLFSHSLEPHDILRGMQVIFFCMASENNGISDWKVFGIERASKREEYEWNFKYVQKTETELSTCARRTTQLNKKYMNETNRPISQWTIASNQMLFFSRRWKFISMN